jgi:hypothetical protein
LPAGEDRWLEHTAAAMVALGGRVGAGGPVTLVLPPHVVLAKIIRPPRFERTKREKLIRFAAEEGIPCALAEVVWGHVSAADHDLDVLLAAIKLELVERICAAAKAAGFDVRFVLPSSLATLAAFRLAPGVKEPVLVLNLGARSATLLLVMGRRFVVRTLTCRLLEEGNEGFATRLAQEITRSILYFRRQGGLEDPARILLAGGGANLAGLPEALALKLQVPVERLDAPALMDIDKALPRGEGAAAIPQLADLAGAAATQMFAGHPVVNLLPPSLRYPRRRRRLQLAGASLVIALASLPFLPVDPVATAGATPAIAVHRPDPAPETAGALEASSFETPREVAVAAVSESPEATPAALPLRILGYFAGPTGYWVAFTSATQPETLLVRCGHRFESHGLTLRSFEVRKIAVNHADAWPVYEVVGLATLHDEISGRDVVLESRRDNSGLLLSAASTGDPGQPSVAPGFSLTANDR